MVLDKNPLTGINLSCQLSKRQQAIVRVGGLLAFMKEGTPGRE